MTTALPIADAVQANRQPARIHYGNAAHLIVSNWCRFHLATQIGEVLISTVGEYWPERPSREIHAEIYDPSWFKSNRHLKGDAFDAAYQERFGYQEIGYERRYETMVFKVDGECPCGCGLPMHSGSNIDFDSYKDPKEANAGHEALCQKYASGIAPVQAEIEI